MSRQAVDKIKNKIDRRTAAQLLSISQRTLDRLIKNKDLISRKVKRRVWLSKEDVLRYKDMQLEDSVNTSTRQHCGIKKDEKHGIITKKPCLDMSRQVSTSVYSNSDQKEVLLCEEQQVMHNDKSSNDDIINMLSQSIDNVVKTLTVQNKVTESSNKIIDILSQDTYLTDQQANGSQAFNYHYSEGIYQKLYNDLLKEHKYNQKRLEAANYHVGQLEGQVSTMIPLLEHRKQRDNYKKIEMGLRTEVRKREMQLKKARTMLYSEQLNKWIFAILVFALIASQPIIWILQK